MAIVGEETLKILLTSAFWRMAIFWPIALVYSYILLFIGDTITYFAPLPVSPLSGGFSSDESLQKGKLPVCIVTGVSGRMIVSVITYLSIFELWTFGAGDVWVGC